MDGSPLGSSVHGDSPGKNTGVACHFLLQMNLPDPGVEPMSLKSSALAGRFYTTSASWEALPHILCPTKLPSTNFIFNERINHGVIVDHLSQAPIFHPN